MVNIMARVTIASTDGAERLGKSCETAFMMTSFSARDGRNKVAATVTRFGHYLHQHQHLEHHHRIQHLAQAHA